MSAFLFSIQPVVSVCACLFPCTAKGQGWENVWEDVLKVPEKAPASFERVLRSFGDVCLLEFWKILGV